MITPRVSDLLGIIGKIAPFHLAEDWDNSGLQVGDPAASVERILVALDPSRDALESAITAPCQLLLTHHPLIFSPLKKITASDPLGSVIIAAIRNGVSVIAAHTNYDSVAGGLNDILAARLGLNYTVPLKVSDHEELVKLVVFVPRGHEEAVMEALFKFSGFIGNYRDCSFRSSGTGTFTPLKGAQPFVGSVGSREEVAEVRLEVLLKKRDLSAALRAMMKAHPYEEPTYDLYPLLNQVETSGLGRIGRLSEEIPLDSFAQIVKESLSLPYLRLAGRASGMIGKVAVCSGSGASLIREAARQGADVLVTADVKYHDARDAEALGLAIVDAGHFGTEVLAVQGLAQRLRQELADRKLLADVMEFREEREPFRLI